MPELPEVETVRLQLLHALKGEKVRSVTVFHTKPISEDPSLPKELPGMTIRHIDRIGKLLIISFAEHTDTFLLIHLKMTGQCIVRTPQGLAGGGHTMERHTMALPHAHTRLQIDFQSGKTLYFNDMRLFGYIKRVSKTELADIKSRYGPEPIATPFPLETIAETIVKKNTSIKAALLDQSLIAGLGNIYVDETLFAAKVHPERIAASLSTKEVRMILKKSRAILEKAVTVGGTTFQHFVDTGGSNGNYSDYLLVFGKQNTPCPRCKTNILKIRVAGRGTHYCPTCQR